MPRSLAAVLLAFAFSLTAPIAQEPARPTPRPAARPPAKVPAKAPANAPAKVPARPGVKAPKAPQAVRPAVPRPRWRCVGPANMSGRITDIAVDPDRRATWYVASASGGLFKTTNAGTTFTPVFDKAATVSLGCVALAPSNPRTVWVGTGEANVRNSVSWGDGVYVSRDAGKTWKHAGLKGAFQIGRIAVHPKNEKVVFVAAGGRLWGENEERGLYRTADGGKTWAHVLKVDKATGAVEVVVDPKNPDIVYAATWERARDGFDGNHPSKRWGKGSGLWKSTDGGRTFRRLTKGLPTVAMGRICLSLYPRDPRILYAIIDTERMGWRSGTHKTQAPPTKGKAKPAPSPRAPRGTAYLGVAGGETDAAAKGVRVRVQPGGPAAEAGLRSSDLIVAVADRPVTTYPDLLAQLRRRRAGDRWALKVIREGKTKGVLITLGDRRRRAGRGFSGRLGGQVENVQKRQGPEGFETGGVFRSDDGGESWRRVNSLNPRPYYFSAIEVDPCDPDRVYVLGVGYYTSADGGKTFKPARGHRLHPDFHTLWIDPADPRHLVIGEDAGLAESWDRGRTYRFFENIPVGQYYHVSVDNDLPYRLYGGLQDNGSWVAPSRTRFADGILPDDCFNIGGGDGFVCAPHPTVPGLVYSESQMGNIRWQNLLTGARGSVRKPRPPKGKGLRYNWDTPFLLSPFAPEVLWSAGNYVVRTVGRGRHPGIVSPEISRTERGSATTLAESPRVPGLLYVGTDDGAIWRGEAGGKKWFDLTDKVPGMPGHRYVSCLEPSRAAPGRVYLAYDGHRSDDMAVHLYVSEDYGKSWKRIGRGIPRGPIHEVREDPRNTDLLYAGTEFGVFASLNRGRDWFSLKGNLPTVAVRDLAVQVREGELAIATHGRGLWILDVSGLQGLTAAVRRKPVALLPPTRVVRWARYPSRALYGHNGFKAPNPRRGRLLHWWLGKPVKGEVALYITGPDGDRIRYLKGSGKAGLHAVHWDLRREGTAVSRRTRRARSGPEVGPGSYGVVLEVGGKTHRTRIDIVPDPVLAGRRR